MMLREYWIGRRWMIPVVAAVAAAGGCAGYFLSAGALRIWAAVAGGVLPLVVACLAFFGGNRAFVRREQMLARCLQAIGKPLDPPGTVEGELRRIHGELQTFKREAEAGRKERRSFILSWADKAEESLESLREIKEALQKENNPACLYLERERLSLYAQLEQLRHSFSCGAGDTQVTVAEVELSKLVSEAVTRNAKLLNTKSIGLRRAVPKTRVYSDQRLLALILDLLLDNAVKFSGEGAVLGFTCRETEEGIRLSLEDSGAGIAAEDLGHIFEKGFAGRNAPQGSPGMGLYLVKSYLDLLGHGITVESRPRRGTRVGILFLPPYPDQEAASSPAD